MDSLIRKANFIHNDEAKREQFDDAVREWLSDNEENCTAKDVPKVLSALSDKVTEKEFPHIHTEGWEQATTAFDHIRNTFDELISEDKSLQRDCIDFVLRLLKCGPATIHMKLILSCINDLELTDYIKSLNGEKLTQIIQALTTDVKPKEKVTEEELYDIHSDFIQFFMDRVFSKEQLDTHAKILLGYFIHLSLDFGHLEEQSCKLLADTGEHIYDALGDPWENFKDITSIKSYIKHCGETFKKPNAFQTEAAEKIALRTMCNLTKTLGAEGKVKEFYQEMIDLALDVSKYPGENGEFALDAFKDVMAFFTRLPSNAVNKDPALFKQAARKYSTAIEDLDRKFLMHTCFATDLLDDFLLKAYGKDKQLTKEWVELMIPLLKCPCVDTLRACADILDEGGAIKWANETEQTTWDGPMSQQLVDKIYGHVPKPITQETSGESSRSAPVIRNVAPVASKPVPNNQENSNPPPTEKAGPATPRKEQQVSSPSREKPQAQEPPKPAPLQTGSKSKSCTVI